MKIKIETIIFYLANCLIQMSEPNSRHIPDTFTTLFRHFTPPNVCPICHEDVIDENENKKLKCGHEFHDKCILEWCKKNLTCPMCRDVINDEICVMEHIATKFNFIRLTYYPVTIQIPETLAENENSNEINSNE
jgi:Ring finger domain